MSKMSAMYVLDSYAPKTLHDVLNKNSVLSLQQWYKFSKKPCLLVGPVGVGKSTLVRLFAKEYNLTLYELTPSDERDKETLEPILQTVSQTKSIFANKNLLFFDDIDVFISEDKQGFETILKAAKESKNPVIFSATNLYSDKRLGQLRDICDIIEIKPPHPATIVNYLSKVCWEKKIKFEKEALEELVKKNSGDLRSTFLDVDYLAGMGGITKKNLELLPGRERKTDVFKTIFGLLKAKTYEELKQIADATEIDYDLLFAWIAENLHLFYEKDNLKEAYELMSLADLNKSRIYLRQNWIFFKYFIALGIIAPCSVPKKDHFTFRIAFPQSIKLKTKELSEYSRNRKASQILSKVLRGSNRRIASELFLYKFFIKEGGFVSYLQKHLSDEDLEFLCDFFKIKLTNVSDKEENKERKVVPKKETKSEKTKKSEKP